MRRLIKVVKILGVIICLTVASLYFILKNSLNLNIPISTEEQSIDMPIVVQLSDSLRICSDSWLKSEEGGISSLFVTGTPYEIGLKNGALTEELCYYQEEAFVKFLREMIPSESVIDKLKYFIAIFNINLESYITPEYKQEIYGVSKSASSDFDFVSPAYHRILNYHASHDVGHAVQNMHLVKCTAFSIDNDSTLLIGRNFDFSSGEDFAKNKIVEFIKPESGYNLMMVTWGGLIGVVSGMNEHGLTVTLNSAPSDIPFSAKTPVSLVAREVLQYAKTIEEAKDIIYSRDLFVSEIFMIGSAVDSDVALIERTINDSAIYRSDRDYTLLTNHFQSSKLSQTPKNIEGMNENISTYRMERLRQIIESRSITTPEDVAAILRDREGLDGKDIGYGNEMSINQLIAHHAVIFEPKTRTAWVSEYPYQVGAFHAYNLDTIFSSNFNILTDPVTIRSKKIESDKSISQQEIDNIMEYREFTKEITKLINSDNQIDNLEAIAEKVIELNPEYYYTYSLLGDLFMREGMFKRSIDYYNISLTKEVQGVNERARIEEAIEAAESLQNLN